MKKMKFGRTDYQHKKTPQTKKDRSRVKVTVFRYYFENGSSKKSCDLPRNEINFSGNVLAATSGWSVSQHKNYYELLNVQHYSIIAYGINA